MLALFHSIGPSILTVGVFCFVVFVGCYVKTFFAIRPSCIRSTWCFHCAPDFWISLFKMKRLDVTLFSVFLSGCSQLQSSKISSRQFQFSGTIQISYRDICTGIDIALQQFICVPLLILLFSASFMAPSVAQTTAQNVEWEGKWIINYKLGGRMRSWRNLMYRPDISLEGLRRITNSLTRDSGSTDQDFNPWPSKCEVGVIPSWQRNWA